MSGAGPEDTQGKVLGSLGALGKEILGPASTVDSGFRIAEKNSMMKIAFISQPLQPISFPVAGSLDVWIYEVSRRLARHCQVTVFTRGEGDQTREMREGVEYRRISLRGDSRIVNILDRFSKLRNPRRPLFASSLYYPGWLRSTARELGKENWDVVHILNFSQLVPFVRRACPGAKIVLNMRCDWLDQLDRRMIEKRLEKVDLVIGCSDHITNNVRSAFPRFAHRCETVWNGTDPTYFSPREYDGNGVGQPRKRLLFAGRVSPEKGLHELIEALPIVLERYPGVELNVVGGTQPAPRDYIVDLDNDPEIRKLSCFYGKVEYHSQLKARIRALGLESNVRFYPHLPHRDLPSHYQAADVFVFPSIFLEPFGVPLIEAMACGKPVVATNAGGIPEIVVHGETGLLVERANPRALAEALLQILEDRSLAKSMGEEGRQRVRQYFTWENVVDNLLTQYQASE